MLEFLAEMLGFGYMQRALLAGACLGIAAPLIGTFLIHRRMALIGETLAHAAFAGVAIGLLVNATFDWSGSPYVVAVVVAVVAALAIRTITESTGIYDDVSLAIVLSGGFALGTIVISMSGGLSVRVGEYLFGNVATVARGDAMLMAGLSLLVLATVVVAYKPLLLVTIDPDAARLAGFDITLFEKLLVALTALVVVAAMQIVGVILVAALLVIPAATAAIVAPSFRASLVLGVLVSELAVSSGITLSYAYGPPAGATIVTVAIAIYVVVAAATSRFGRFGLQST